MKHTRPTWLFAGSLLAALGAPAWSAGDAGERPAPAVRAEGQPVVIIDPGLIVKHVRLVSLDERQVELVDEFGRKRRVPRSQVLALIPDAPAQDRAPAPRRAWSSAPITWPGVLITADAQRFPGELIGPGAAPDTLVWDAGSLGRFEIALERVAWFARRGASDAVRDQPGEGARDSLVLTNGDRLSGFIAALAEPTRIEPEDGPPVEVGLDRVAAARLSNPLVAPRGPRVWLADGTIAAVERVSIDADGRLVLSLSAGPGGSFDWANLRGLSMDAGRLIPLASLAPTSQQATSGRRWAPPIERVEPRAEPGVLPVTPLDAADIVLPGPMRVVYSLPAGAARFCASVALDDASAPWGDCELTISIDQREVLRRRLIAGVEPAQISVETAGKTLVISVDAGKFGPIKDRVVLGRPLLLLEPSGQE